MEIGFRALLLLAKDNDTQAMTGIITMYKPLVIKLSIVDGALDEDLHQELMATLVKCIHKIRNY